MWLGSAASARGFKWCLRPADSRGFKGLDEALAAAELYDGIVIDLRTGGEVER